MCGLSLRCKRWIGIDEPPNNSGCGGVAAWSTLRVKFMTQEGYHIPWIEYAARVHMQEPIDQNSVGQEELISYGTRRLDPSFNLVFLAKITSLVNQYSVSSSLLIL
ncbi:hypothetical protein VNO77_16348 [Canavalia gladiata]|uniref:Uncharacterized protein n=1 Tax=Canavalia gladiata TaxID=3824 RepID=A0AAN9QS04_CANGL